MTSLDLIKLQIERLYKVHPEIHVNVKLTNPKVSLENTRAVITGVYPHIFQIEEYTSDKPRVHTLKYTDVLIRHIVILEMEKGKE